MIQAAWRAVSCPTCGAMTGRCRRPTTFKQDGASFVIYDFAYVSHPHVARIAAGKAKRKGRHTGGRNKA